MLRNFRVYVAATQFYKRWRRLSLPSDVVDQLRRASSTHRSLLASLLAGIVLQIGSTLQMPFCRKALRFSWYLRTACYGRSKSTL
jgi:hypothetical protein